MPHAADVPDVSVVVFRAPSGNLETYRIPWSRSGLLLTSLGPYRTPGAAAADIADTPGDIDPDAPPEYMQALLRLQNCRIPDKAVNGFGAQAPIFAPSMPSGFTLRLGKSFGDILYSGVFDAGGHKIGFLRIPSFSPISTITALTNLQTEIAYFQANTDGLVVDVMRNPGGSVSYLNSVLSYMMPARWRSIPFELRATSEWVVVLSSSLVSATALGAPQSIIDLFTSIKSEIVTANHAMRGRTNPIPLDTGGIDRDPAFDSKGNLIAYTKPMLVLTDEMTASAGDAFAATIQDNGRAPLFGWRTMGAGGNVEGWEAGTYSLGIATVTESLMNRKNPIVTKDYPTAPYVENIGVRPDIEVDYMTLDNLRQSGKPFVDAFTAAIVAQIQKGK
jgi:hypothetical protein